MGMYPRPGDLVTFKGSFRMDGADRDPLHGPALWLGWHNPENHDWAGRLEICTWHLFDEWAREHHGGYACSGYLILLFGCFRVLQVDKPSQWSNIKIISPFDLTCEVSP